MTRISSGATFWYKRVFPVLWFGFIAAFLITVTVSGLSKDDFPFLIAPLAMAALGFLLMKKLLWDLVDEVYDGGDFLLVKNRGEEERIPLSNIMNVSATTFTNPPRVTLRLVRSSKFGTEVVFSPATGWRLLPFSKIPIIDNLIVRVDRARVNASR